MKKILFIVLMCLLAFGACDFTVKTADAQEFTMPKVEGNFKYLPVAKVLTLGAGAMIADFSKDDSATPVSLEGWVLPKKFLYSSSLKGSVAWVISGDSKETGLVPDYGGLEMSIDFMKLVKNLGATKVNTNVALSLDTGAFFDIESLFGDPAVLRIEPTIGASLRMSFKDLPFIE